MIARVVFAVPLTFPFSYRVPENLAGRAVAGVRVLAPLGRRKRTGIIVGFEAEPPEPGFELKDIEAVLDAEPVFGAGLLTFVTLLAGDALSSAGELLMSSLPPKLKGRETALWRLTDKGREALAVGRDLTRLEKKAAGLLAGAPKRGYSARHIAQGLESRDAAGLLTRMKAKGLVGTVEKTGVSRARKAAAPVSEPEVTKQLGLAFGASGSGDALSTVETGVAEGSFAFHYIMGRAGTLEKAYQRLLDRASAAGRASLVLTGEAERAEELAGRLSERSGTRPVVFHGRMTPREREEAWRAASTEGPKVVVGTRSAVLQPLEDLGLIVVDGEDDEAHSQAESPSYDARRAALIRARTAGIPLVFSSSRPTVEAFHEASEYVALIDLDDAQAAGGAASIVGRPPAGAGRVISSELAGLVREALAGPKGKAVLFINRRGLAASLVCPSCGFMVRCRRCGIPLVPHRRRNGVRLLCHYCNAEEKLSESCPQCGRRLEISRNPGIQALEEELKAVFGGVPVARFDADTASDQDRRRRLLDDFARGRTRLMVGTSLLAGRVPVGGVGLAAVIGPERILAAADYRAGWNAFRTVTAMLDPFRDSPGTKLAVQTTLPAHFSIETAARGDGRAFYRRELEYRKLLGYPPFAAMAEVGLSGRDIRALARRSRAFAEAVKREAPGVEALGPVLLPPGSVRGSSGVQFILKAGRREDLAGPLGRLLLSAGPGSRVTFSHSLVWKG